MVDAEKAMIALYNHLAAGSPIPKDVANYLQDKTWDWLTTREMTLDQAFGLAEAGPQVKGRQNRQKHIPVLYEICQEYLARGEALEPNWPEIGEQIGQGGAYAKKLWNETNKAYAKSLKESY
jgi:hypothetical protein